MVRMSLFHRNKQRNDAAQSNRPREDDEPINVTVFQRLQSWELFSLKKNIATMLCFYLLLLGVLTYASSFLRAKDCLPHWLTRLNTKLASRRAKEFQTIAATNSWNNPDAPPEERSTVAGPGSTVSYTAPVREWIGSLLANSTLGIRTMADLSCSELEWQTLIPGFDDLASFHGFDIVPDVVDRARAKAVSALAAKGVRPREVEHGHEHGAIGSYGLLRARQHIAAPFESATAFEATKGMGLGPALRFAVDDLVNGPPLPAYDVVMVRDTLMHLSLTDALAALERIDASGSRYLITTTFDTGEHQSNTFIRPGSWYPINLQQLPFELGEPLSSVKEGLPGVDYYGKKTLALWQLPVVKR